MGAILLADPYQSFEVSDGINFYSVAEPFDASDSLNTIKNYVDNECDFLDDPELKIILDENVILCSQTDDIVTLNPFFTISGGATIDESLNDFCNPDYFNNLILLNPPVPVILTDDFVTINTEVEIAFRINDEETPIDYIVGFQGETLNSLSGQATEGVRTTYILNLTTKPDGNYTTQIKATDNQGITAYSNEITITVHTP